MMNHVDPPGDDILTHTTSTVPGSCQLSAVPQRERPHHSILTFDSRGTSVSRGEI